MKLCELFSNLLFVLEAGGVGRVVKGVNTTPDVGPNEIKKQAKKFGFKVDKDGRPPVIREEELDELTPYKNHQLYKQTKSKFKKTFGDYSNRESALNSFMKLMQKNGFKKIGQGMYAVAFEKPGYPWVFKLFHEDSAYKMFLDYVIKNQSNPHLPKLKGHYIKISDDTYLVRMEKLKPLTDKELELNLERLAGDFTYDPINRKTVNWLKTNYPAILKILKDIRKIANKQDFEYYMDTHSKNIMQRADGTPVVTDPLS